jgi:hypothetical protein
MVVQFIGGDLIKIVRLMNAQLMTIATRNKNARMELALTPTEVGTREDAENT